MTVNVAFPEPYLHLSLYDGFILMAQTRKPSIATFKILLEVRTLRMEDISSIKIVIIDILIMYNTCLPFEDFEPNDENNAISLNS